MRRPHVAAICQNPICGRTFMARVYDVQRGWGLCCSRTCSARVLNIRYPKTGANNPGFKGWRSLNHRYYVNRFRAKYPEKAAAHDAVKNALAAGRLVKPTVCQRCGESLPLHSHHPDYTQPLVVVFACRPCHRVLDVERREALSAAKAS